MGLASGLVVYIILWWVTLFAVLPWGILQEPAPEKGHDRGAPTNPRIGLKFAVTTIIAGLLWAGVYALVTSGIINVREL
jgi:predicted secreted protein|tara:strand:- start:654 stop:890 length:237 start_codon:yes stop_codon:yes gene_type:complete